MGFGTREGRLLPGAEARRRAVVDAGFGDRETCEHCGKPLYLEAEDGELHVKDPRLALLCMADDARGVVCPVRQAEYDREQRRADEDPPSWRDR